MIIYEVKDLLLAAKNSALTFKTEVWWRGQSIDWPLLPGVKRIKNSNKGSLKNIEMNLTVRFLLDAKSRHYQWPDDDTMLQLALMQHYGLPTRLLYWTESPLFALFFSTNNNYNEPGVLWALSPSALNKIDFDTQQLLSPSREDVRELFNAPFGLSKISVNKIGALAYSRIDTRMASQLSTFTIHGSSVPLEKRSCNNQYLIKFLIPAKAKKIIRLELIDLGIRESTLFPDLDHLAHELKGFAEQEIL